MNSQIIAIVGQIASGKTTLARYLTKAGFQRVVTYTTRPRRDNEKDGADYIFIPDREFLDKKDAGFFAESTEYQARFGHVYYGTGKDSLETPGGVKKAIVLNPAGVITLKNAGYDIFTVYLDFEQSLLMRRALNRGDSPVEIGRRIADDTRLFDLLEIENYINLRVTDSTLLPHQIADLIQANL